MSDVLVDSSAWIDFLRGNPNACARIDPLLADNRAAVAGLVLAEVLSGARDRPTYSRLERVFGALPVLMEPAGLWPRIAETRFLLARAGFQAAITDLMIATIAFDTAHVLLTRDHDFEHIRQAVPFDLDLF